MPKKRTKSQKPSVGIIMGSDSDLPVMKEALEILELAGVPYKLLILSAHRTPDETFTFARQSAKQGISVLIAGAGGAAHLPGVIAALTTLPVIGVPIHTKTLQGVDSLYSIVQMPPGVPVATVGINAAKNAGLLAVEILAVGNAGLTGKLIRFRKDQRAAVLRKTEKLSRLGWKKYLEQKERG